MPTTALTAFLLIYWSESKALVIYNDAAVGISEDWSNQTDLPYKKYL
jgi:hypothetical protein